ncbi:MAG: TetR/AcrR family transcriptional regulator C-terminal domain-containing protein [Actinomycetota bacterium]|nr:TetR/AcrR family transcriptional regulator C-terminal domain-containing protein [Actinomycetota bacterium]
MDAAAQEQGAGSALGSTGARSRPRRKGPGVSRELIIETTLRFVEGGDEDALTMRALGSELGVSAMALYRYFDSKEQILDEVVDALLARVAPPSADPAAWEAWIEESALDLRGVLVRYPAALATFTSHPVTTPAALARIESALGVLRSAGFEGSDAAQAFAAVHTYTIGFAALEVSRSRTLVPGGGEAQVSRYWHLYFGTLPADRFPNLVELAVDLAEFTSEGQFTVGLRRLLSGLRVQLDSRGESPLT